MLTLPPLLNQSEPYFYELVFRIFMDALEYGCDPLLNAQACVSPLAVYIVDSLGIFFAVVHISCYSFAIFWGSRSYFMRTILSAIASQVAAITLYLSCSSSSTFAAIPRHVLYPNLSLSIIRLCDHHYFRDCLFIGTIDRVKGH
jgi:hypothetical protein